MNKYMIAYGLLAGGLLIGGCGDNESDSSAETAELGIKAGTVFSKCAEYQVRMQKKSICGSQKNYVKACEDMIGFTIRNPAKCIKRQMCNYLIYTPVCSGTSLLQQTSGGFGTTTSPTFTTGALQTQSEANRFGTICQQLSTFCE
ncbi:MAG: hypothetical protein AAF320_06145 [Myxococcota bacterium]